MEDGAFDVAGTFGGGDAEAYTAGPAGQLAGVAAEQRGSQMAPVVILDTTALREDPGLSRTASRVLFAAVGERLLELLVPDVAVREAVNLRQRDIRRAVTEYRSSCHRLVGLGATPSELALETETKLVRRYDQVLRSAIESHGGVIGPIPDPSHDLLVDRAIQRRKPFNEKGAGYRDALIWETVLLAAVNSEVYFVTMNHLDFCSSMNEGGQGVLHEHLIEDLRQRFIGLSRISIYSSLDTLVRNRITSDPGTWLAVRAGTLVEQVLDAMQRHRVIIERAIIAYLEPSASGMEIYTLQRGRFDDTVKATRGGVSEIAEFAVYDVNEQPGDIVVAHGTVGATIGAEFREPVRQGAYSDHGTYFETKIQTETRITFEWQRSRDRIEVLELDGHAGRVDLRSPGGRHGPSS